MWRSELLNPHFNFDWCKTPATLRVSYAFELPMETSDQHSEHSHESLKLETLSAHLQQRSSGRQVFEIHEEGQFTFVLASCIPNILANVNGTINLLNPQSYPLTPYPLRHARRVTLPKRNVLAKEYSHPSIEDWGLHTFYLILSVAFTCTTLVWVFHAHQVHRKANWRFMVGFVLLLAAAAKTYIRSRIYGSVQHSIELDVLEKVSLSFEQTSFLVLLLIVCTFLVRDFATEKIIIFSD